MKSSETHLDEPLRADDVAAGCLDPLDVRVAGGRVRQEDVELGCKSSRFPFAQKQQGEESFIDPETETDEAGHWR